MMNYGELIEKAIEILKDDADLFCELVDELDSYMGLADGFRVFGMYELNDLYYGRPATDLLNDIDGNHFDLSDEYFVDTIYGLRSIEDKYTEYHDNIDEGELLDNVIEYYGRISINDSDFEALINDIIEAGR